MSLLLIVEDSRGQEAFKLLVRKIRPRTGVRTRHMEKGDMLNVQMVAHLLRLHVGSRRKPSRILICRDSECTDIQETRQLCAEAERRLQERLGPRFPEVRYIVVDHSLEGWLGSDENALRAVLGQEAQLPSSNPEDNCRPADLLDRVFETNGRDGYEKSRHATQLAQACSPENIAARSATFRYFQQSVRG